MRIKGIEIDQYGIYDQRVFGEGVFSHPFTVIYGPNEAGKSTLHSFLLGMLFGFDQKASKLHHKSGQAIGGRLMLDHHKFGQVTLERQTPPQKGVLNVLGHEGLTEQDLLGQMSVDVYKQIFAFSHLELQHLHSLHNEDVSAYLYSAAMGTGTASFWKLEKKLKQEADALYRPKATQRPLNIKRDQVEKREQNVQRLANQQEEYARIQEQMKEERLNRDHHRGQLQTFQNEKHGIGQVLHLLDQIEELNQEIVELEHECLVIEDDFEQVLKQLGEPWTKQRIQTLKLSMPDRESLLFIGEQVKQTEASLTHVRTKITEQQGFIHDLTQDIQQRSKTLERVKVGGAEAEVDEATYAQTGASTPAFQSAFQPTSIMRKISFLGGSILFFTMMIVLGIMFFPDSIGLTLWFSIGFVCLIVLFFKLDQKKEQEIHALAKWQRENQIVRDEEQSRLAHLQQQKRKHTALLQNYRGEQEQVQTRYNLEYAQWTTSLKHVGLPELISVDAASRIFRLLEDALYQFNLTQKLRSNLSTRQKKMRPLTTIVRAEMVKVQLDRLSDDRLIDETDHWSSLNMERLRSLCRTRMEEIEELARGEQRSIEIGSHKMGECESILTQIATDASWDHAEQLLAEEQQEFDQLAKKWSVHKLAEHICRTTRKVYEEQRQPQVIQWAGKYLQQLTNGAYKQIIAPLDQHDLYVVNANDQRLSTQQLSRGACELLYLVIRFALIEDYRQHAPLPILMDDPFVHFDRERLGKVLQMCDYLSTSNQMILMTCHQHVVDDVRQYVPNAHVSYLS